MPRLNGRRSTTARAARATSAVRSVEPSSMTTISSAGSYARISPITRATDPSSSRAGTIAMARTSANGLQDADEVEYASRSVRVRVLVQHALARATPEFLGLRRIGEQLVIGR